MSLQILKPLSEIWKDMLEIIHGLYLGRAKLLNDNDELNQNSIKCVFSVVPYEMLFEKREDIKYTNVLVQKYPNEDLLLILPETIEMISTSLVTTPNILITFDQEVDCSAALIIGYLMKYNRLTLHNALSYINEKRPIKIKEELIHQLGLFELLEHNISAIDQLWAKRYFWFRLHEVYPHYDYWFSKLMKYINCLWDKKTLYGIGSSYLCKICKNDLFNEEDIICIIPKDKDSLIFLYPIKWILSNFFVFKNKRDLLKCPQCQNILGFYDWNGLHDPVKFVYNYKVEDTKSCKLVVPLIFGVMLSETFPADYDKKSTAVRLQGIFLKNL